MIVPQFWAEARIQERLPDRQVTVRRFGWSDISLQAAQDHADQRVCGETVVTRNSYGARCLNTPDVFFADVDFTAPNSDSLLAFVVKFGCVAIIAITIGF